MLYYCFRMAKGEFTGVTASEVSEKYAGMLSSVPTLILLDGTGHPTVLWHLQHRSAKGCGKDHESDHALSVWRIMVILTIRSVTLSGSSEGLRFFLVPDFERMAENGIGNVIFGAMSQAFFHLEHRNGRHGDLRKLSGQKTLPCRRICQHRTSGHLCGADGRTDRDSFLLRFWRRTRCRTGTCIHHAAEHFHTDGRRTDLGLFILPVFILCGTVHHCRSLREHCLFLDGSVWMEENQSRGDQYSPDHSFKYSMYPRIQRMVRFPAAWRRHKHYGSGRLYCIQQYPSARLSCISFVLYAQKRMGLETFHSGSQQRQTGLKFPAKVSLLYDPYPAMDRCGHLSERLLRHVPSTGYDSPL